MGGAEARVLKLKGNVSIHTCLLIVALDEGIVRCLISKRPLRFMEGLAGPMDSC